MDEYGSWKRTEEIEIDLGDMLRQICMKWKQVLLCALVFAVAFGGYGYLKNRTNTAISSSNDAEIVMEAKDIILTEDEQQSVSDAVLLSTEVKRLEEYLDQSFLMKADPYHKNVCVMLYSIEEAKSHEVQKIVESYLSYILNGGAAEALKKNGNKNWKTDKSYLAELLDAYQKTYSSAYQAVLVSDSAADVQGEALFYVEVTGQNAKTVKQLAEDMQTVLKDYSSVAKKNAGRHKLSLVNVESNVLADSGLQTRQNDKRSQLAANLANLKAQTDMFNRKQMAVYQDIAGIEESGEDAQADVIVSEAGVSVKYILFGLMGGIFVYGGAFACWYLFRDTVKSGRELKALYTFPYYGCISLHKKSGRNLSAVKSNLEGEKARILKKLRTACTKQGITRLCLASAFSVNRQEKECLQSVTEQLKEWGIDAVLIENVTNDASVWDTLEETGHVLMVCRIGTTTHQMIDDEMEFYLENDTAVAGAMAFVIQN